MLTREDMPDDNAKLAAIPVELPSVPSEKVVSPDRIVPDLLDYLRREGFPPDSGLWFLRNALVGRTLYLIWAFESGGEPGYATASGARPGVDGPGRGQLLGAEPRTVHPGLVPRLPIAAEPPLHPTGPAIA